MTEPATWEHLSVGLLHSGSVLTTAWGQRPVHLEGFGADSVLDDLDTIVATDLLAPPFVSMFNDQWPVDVARYTKEVAGAASLTPTRLLDRKKMLEELKNGAAIKFNRMQLWNARVRGIAEHLSEHFGHHVEVWGFFSGTGRAMLPWHRDHADNIAIQISGTKRWYVGGAMPTTNGAENYHRFTSEIQEFCLAPGDVLYIPFGWAHKAEAVSPTSYHVSIAVETPSVDTVRQAMLSTMARGWTIDGMQPMRAFNLPALMELFPAAMSDEVRRVWNEHDATELRDVLSGRC